MKTMMLAGAAILTLGLASAYAGDGEGPVANTQFTEIPNVVAQAQVPNAPAYAANQGNTSVFATQSHTVHVFPWNQNEGVGG
jgi:hypothetical protein